MDEEFEQDYCSRTTRGVYKIGDDSITFLRWMAQFVRFYKNIHFFN